MSRLRGFLLITLTISLIILVKSDFADEECNIWVNQETTTVEIAADKPKNLSSVSKMTAEKRKKSLVFVFDATSSMSEDLAQLKGAAKEIITAFSEQKENPISNYILSVFRDPEVERLQKSNNPSQMLADLDAIKVHGGGDTPELALAGLEQAVEKALPNSIAFLFSDAIAKDVDLFYNVKKKLQRKQITVYFLITGVSDSEKSVEGYKVYEKLAKSSGGLVFDMKRNSIQTLMSKLKNLLNLKFETLKSFNYDAAGTNKETVKCDGTLSKVSFIVSGKNSKLAVRDQNNNLVNGDDYSLDNVKFLTFDVTDSAYTIEASADSAYSVRVGGISDLKFEFGFSTNLPTDQSETFLQPLVGHKNVLSVFVSDPKLIKCLVRATISPVTTENSFADIEVFFDHKYQNFYASPLLELPSQMFNIKVFGYDKKGIVIERLISSGIESISGSEKHISLNYISRR